MKPLSRESLLEDVRSLFLPATNESSRNSRGVGAELEMIPVESATGRRILAHSENSSGAGFVASLGKELGWTEVRMDPDPSCWEFQDGRLTFEPGGQIELSSAVFPTASGLIASLEKWMAVISSRAAHTGIELKTFGIDDLSSIQDVPLQLHRERYSAMTNYFESIGAFGILMMRQTASLQINVDRGEQPTDRWRLLNALAPYLVAIFANSPNYAGKSTGHKSYRAHVWRMLDAWRSGIPYDRADPIGRYLDFALDAPVILAQRGNVYPTFRELLVSDKPTKEMWDIHLTTLFPEIRPREYFEIRSIDAIDPAHVSAAVAFVCGLVYSDDSAAAAADLLGNPDALLLSRAGQFGLGDSEILARAITLVELALDGCRTLGPGYISKSDLIRAEVFFQRYTVQGRSPADDRPALPGPSRQAK